MLITIKQPVANDFELMNQLIIQQLHSSVPLVENIGHYIVDSGGKRLRPLLTLLSAKAAGYTGNQHIDLAAIVEFIHTATLLHDDVVDISSLRRGKPTANAQWGNASSVLVGDFLYSRAFQMLVTMGDIPVMQNLANTTNYIAEGEVLQLINAGDPSTSETQYFDVIERKTAILFEAACYCGALISPATDKEKEALKKYGLHIGMAFQIADDMLDYTGDPEVMGKNLGDDLAEGKVTLPLIYLLQHGLPSEKELISNAIKNKDRSQLTTITSLVQQSDALTYTAKKAQDMTNIALCALDGVAPSPALESLKALAALAINRQV